MTERVLPVAALVLTAVLPTLILGGCSCRVVEVSPGARLAGPDLAALPPNYLRLPIDSKIGSGGAYAVFDVVWSEAGEDGALRNDGVQVVVESEGKTEAYEPGDGEDLSLGSEAADAREVVSVYWASDDSSSWSLGRLWQLPIETTGLRVGEALDPVRRRRLLENAGILLLQIDPLLQTLAPWAIEWVRERPISLFLALDSEQRSALTRRSIVKLMTSLVDMDFERARDLGFGRTQIPVRIGVPDIDFAVGEVTLFHSADGAKFTLGVESLTLNIDDERRVELRLAGFGTGWPTGISDRLVGEADPLRSQWPLCIAGSPRAPRGDKLFRTTGDDELDARLSVDSGGQLHALLADRFAVLHSGGDCRVLDLERPRGEPVLRSASARAIAVDEAATRTERGLVSVVTVSTEERRAPVVHVFAFDDDEVLPLARVSAVDPGDDEPVRVFSALSPRGDSFVIPDGPFLVLLRIAGRGTSVVDRFPAEEAVANYLLDGTSVLFRSKSAFRLIEVTTGEVLASEAGVEHLIVGSEHFMFRDSDGVVRVLRGDGVVRFQRDLGDAEPRLIDDIFELGWAIEDGVLTEIDFDDEVVETVALDFDPRVVQQFEEFVLVSGLGETGPASIVREIESGSDRVMARLDGERAFGFLGDDAEDFTVFVATPQRSVEAAAASDDGKPAVLRLDASAGLRRFENGKLVETIDFGALDPIFSPTAPGEDEQDLSEIGRFECRELEDDRVLVQAGARLWLLDLGGRDRWQLQLPYRARDRSRPLLTEEPEWIVYGRQGQSHALSVRELAEFAETVLKDPSSPLVLEAFPGLRPLQMVRALEP